MKKLLSSLGLMCVLLAPAMAFAQDAAAPVAEAVAAVETMAMDTAEPVAVEVAAVVTEEVAPVPNKGDTTWMMVSTLLVILMIIPGVALFYGGLVRAKNMLSVLMQEIGRAHV